MTERAPDAGAATPADHRVAALAAVFAPERAAAFASRLAGPAAARVAAEAEELIRAGRRERLTALARALAPPTTGRVATESPTARPEAPRIAALLLALCAGEPTGDAHPLLVRACRERLAR